MNIHVYHHFGDDLFGIKQTLNLLLIQGEKMAQTQAELAADLNKVTAQVAKIGVETGKTLEKVTELETLLAAGGNTTPEVDAAMAALKAQAQATDDLVPD